MRRATRFVAEVAASPCGNHLAQVWQVGEGVSPTLDAQIQNKIFIDGGRDPLSAVGSRPVHVINVVLRIRAQKFRSSASFRAGRRDGTDLNLEKDVRVR